MPWMVDDLDTPAVLVDLDRVEANLRRAQDYADAHGLKLRPHIKTHKLPELARRQVELGAVGITCQKLGEAEVMADAGLDDILLTFNLLGRPKLARLIALARRTRLAVTLDNDLVAQGLSLAMTEAGLELPVLIECDTGGQRCGVQDAEEALALARLVNEPPRPQLRRPDDLPRPGQHSRHPSLARHGTRPPRRSRDRAQDRQHRRHARPLCRARGDQRHRAPPRHIHLQRPLPGGDRPAHARGLRAPHPDHRRLPPREERLILDAGSKTISSDTLGMEGFGHVVEYPQLAVAKLSEEHGHVDAAASNARPGIGERVTLIPNHACAVSNLHDVVYGVRGDRVERAFHVAARGRVS